MHGLDFIPALLPISGDLWAYGPAPGVELIPYFFGLLAIVGMAILAILMRFVTSIMALFSALLVLLHLRKDKSVPPPAEPKNEATADKSVESLRK